MVRLGLFVAAAIVLIVAAVAAGISRNPASTYERDDVVHAFAGQGYALAEPVRDLGWTGYGPLAGMDGILLFPRPIASAPFYVFVARQDATARTFFKQLAQLGRSTDAFDLIRGNVLVSSDASFTESGLSKNQKQRIRAAMNSLSTAS
jgi:hypothetical protein